MEKELFWSKNMLLNHLELDEDHQSFVSIVNDMYRSYYTKDMTLADNVFERCFSFARTHFSREEAILAEIGFPDIESHQKSHQAFYKNILEFKELFLMIPQKEERLLFVLKTADYLKSWFLGHLLGRDRVYKPYLVRLNNKKEN